MLLGAMLDAGLDRKLLESPCLLPLTGYKLAVRRVRRSSLAAMSVEVRVSGDHGHRGWKGGSARSCGADGCSRAEADAALAIFERLIRVEARLHRIPMERVHLHELGAVDAIVDIVGAVVGLPGAGRGARRRASRLLTSQRRPRQRERAPRHAARAGPRHGRC